MMTRDPSLYGLNFSQVKTIVSIFFFCSLIILLCFIKSLVGIVNDSKDFLYSLPKNCSHCIITGITHNLKVLAPVRHYHDGDITNMDLISLNTDLHPSSNSKFASSPIVCIMVLKFLRNL